MSSMTPSVEPSAAAGTSQHTDRVVRELDVYVANGALGGGTQTYLLQCPLRPTWRPYQEEGFEKVQFKPKVKKLQCEARLETSGRNYNSDVEPSREIKSLTLQSSRVEMRSQLAGAYVEGDVLVLFPIDEALQLRPCMAYLDKEKEAAAAAKKAGEGGGEAGEEGRGAPELMPLTVQVKRRETEHQQQARLRSYAYLQQQEEQDTWVDLRYHGEDSDVAAKAWGTMNSAVAQAQAQAQEVRHTMSRPQYLEAIVPGAASLEQPPQEMDFGGNVGLIDLGQPSCFASRRAMEEAAARRGRALALAAPAPGAARRGAGGAGSGSAAGRDEAGWEGPPGGSGGESSWAQAQAAAAAALPEEVVAALPAVVAQVLKYSPVLSLDQIRRFIQNMPDGPAKPAAMAPDAALHASVLAGDTVLCIRKCYMHKRLGNPTLDPLRDILLELLAEREAIKRSDIIEAAKAKGIQVSDTLYSKVLKELCVSRGSAWSLKAPA